MSRATSARCFCVHARPLYGGENCAGRRRGRMDMTADARPLYNEGEEISALDNDVDKWLHGGLDDGSMRYSETFHSLGAITSRFSCAKAMVY